MALVGLLALASCAVLIDEERSQAGKARVARDFQTLLHGIGLGPAVDPSECAFAFDPRLSGRCSYEQGPLPQGGTWCPYHALSIFAYPPLDVKDQNAHLH